MQFAAMEKKSQDLEKTIVSQQIAHIKAAEEAARVAEEQRRKIAEEEAARIAAEKKAAQIVVAARAKEHRRGHLEMKRMIHFNCRQALEWRRS